VVAGLPVARALFRLVDERLAFSPKIEDGDRVEAGQTVATVKGPGAPLLTAERPALNLVGRFSGIASLTRRFVDAVQLPVLANITEFGKTPLYTRDQLKSVGVSMVLYPLSAFRAMNAAAREVYETIRQTGTQQSLVDRMQSREELYQVLNYYAYECKLDELFSKHGKPEQSKPSSD
jgi:hypothetical protein